MNKINNAFTGFLFAFFGAILFSTKAIIVKKAFADTQVDALTLLTIRMIFSLPFFLAASVLVNHSTGNIRLSHKQWLSIILLGLFGYYLSSYFDFAGLQFISAGLERLILFLYPSMVALINRVFFKQPITRAQVAALALTYLGIGIAYFDEMQLENANPDFIIGSILVLMCSITYAVYISGSGRLIPVVGASKFTAYAMLSATAGIFTHFLLQGSFVQLSEAAGLWEYGLVLSLVATVAPVFLISAGLKRIGSNNVAIISSVGPVSTIIQAQLILGERILTGQIIGTVMVIMGVLLTGWKSRDQAVKAG